MIKGIGIDIVEINRLARVLNRQPRLPERILTLSEQDIFNELSEKRQLEFLAGRFVAKEAFAKAYGTGIGRHLSFHDLKTNMENLSSKARKRWATRFMCPSLTRKNMLLHKF